jgi:hypothetical protein
LGIVSPPVENVFAGLPADVQDLPDGVRGVRAHVRDLPNGVRGFPARIREVPNAIREILHDKVKPLLLLFERRSA